MGNTQLNKNRGPRGWRVLCCAGRLAAFSTLFFSTVSAQMEEKAIAPVAETPSEPLTYSLFQTELASDISRVAEFKAIQEWAAKKNVTVYLFGGTAASFAHYSLWSRKYGELNSNMTSFKLFHIFRSRQDLDLVVDGSPDTAEQLEKWIEKSFPYLHGDKSSWEIRLLRDARNGKSALLDHFDFQNQHTDSQSVGLIPLDSKLPIRDLRHWDQNPSPFLKDILNSKIHYYFSDTHEQTSLAKSGRNPSIVSSIRYLIKAFQFDLEFGDDDLNIITSIVQRFDPSTIAHPYLKSWIIRNAPNLVRYSRNLERTFKILDETGLRQKLSQLDDRDTPGSLAWWMNKSPLRSFEIGLGNGKTAKDLGLSIVTHETQDYDAFEGITRSPQGKPLVLISRKNQVGERATYGDGFYVSNGTRGIRHGSFASQFKIDPKARLGSDFKINEWKTEAEGKIPSSLLILNGNAIRYEPAFRETLNIETYFSALCQGSLSSGTASTLLPLLKSEAAQLTQREWAAIFQSIFKKFTDTRKPSGSTFMQFLEQAHSLVGSFEEANSIFQQFVGNELFLQKILTLNSLEFFSFGLFLRTLNDGPQILKKLTSHFDALNERQRENLEEIVKYFLKPPKRFLTEKEDSSERLFAGYFPESYLLSLPIALQFVFIASTNEDLIIRKLLPPFLIGLSNMSQADFWIQLGPDKQKIPAHQLGYRVGPIDSNEFTHDVFRVPYGSLINEHWNHWPHDIRKEMIRSLFYSENMASRLIILNLAKSKVTSEIYELECWKDTKQLARILDSVYPNYIDEAELLEFLNSRYSYSLIDHPENFGLDKSNAQNLLNLFLSVSSSTFDALTRMDPTLLRTLRHMPQALIELSQENQSRFFSMLDLSESADRRFVIQLFVMNPEILKCEYMFNILFWLATEYSEQFKNEIFQSLESELPWKRHPLLVKSLQNPKLQSMKSKASLRGMKDLPIQTVTAVKGLIQETASPSCSKELHTIATSSLRP